MTWPFQPTANFPAISSNSGPSTGVVPPKVATNFMIGPHYMMGLSTISYSANDLIYIPIWISEISTWAGIKTRNGGAGDSGDVYRVGIYAEASTGGPGSLIRDCGTVTLDASAAIRTTASSFSNTYIGWHYLAVHFQNAILMSHMVCEAQDSAVARYPLNVAAQAMPSISDAMNSWGGQSPIPFINSAYGSLASTAVTPTSTITSCPQIRIYR